MSRPLHRFSGSVRNWLGRFSGVTTFIIWLSAAVYIVELAFLALRSPWFERVFALSGPEFLRGFVWQPLTYMFLHDPTNLFHILINLFILWFFGREVEYFIGPKYFTRLYLWGGMCGAALWLAFNWQSAIPVLGASAAVLACVIAFATLFPDRDITLLVFFVLPVTLKAKYLAWVAVALDVVPLLTHTGAGVAHLAHLGGAAFGYFYIKHLGYGSPPRWLRWLQSAERFGRPRRPPKPTDVDAEEYIRREVDPILDKIAREGIHSLTRRERKILEAARDLMQKTPR